MLPSRFKRTLVAAAIAPALAVPAVVLAENTAQQQPQAQQSQQQAPTQQGDLRVTRMQDMKVQNARGEDLGEVKDVVIDARSGKVEYVALSHGGFMGIGESLFAYPVSRFEMGPARDALVLSANVTEEQLDERDGFNDDNWPKLRNDRDFWARIDQRFPGAEQSASAGGGAQQQERAFVRASELIGKQVQDRAENMIGEVEDLVVSLSEGTVRFAAIDTPGDDNLVPVPMDALSVREDGGDPALRYERDRMDLSRAFDKNEWPL